MRHDPASGAVIIMLRSLKMHGMAQAVTDLMEQGAPAFDTAVPMLAQLLKAERSGRGRSVPFTAPLSSRATQRLPGNEAVHVYMHERGLSHEGRPLPGLQGPLGHQLRSQ